MCERRGRIKSSGGRLRLLRERPAERGKGSASGCGGKGGEATGKGACGEGRVAGEGLQDSDHACKEELKGVEEGRVD